VEHDGLRGRRDWVRQHHTAFLPSMIDDETVLKFFKKIPAHIVFLILLQIAFIIIISWLSENLVWPIIVHILACSLCQFQFDLNIISLNDGL
jgi:hypothetical protein